MRITLLLALLCTLSSSFAQLPPVITSWIQNNTSTGFADAITNVQQVNYSDTYVYIKTDDIPSWIPIAYDWPNNPWFAVPMNYQFRFRRNPIPNVGPETKTGYGHIGLWLNGCSIYNPKDAKSYLDSLRWFQNAWYWEHLLGETFDHCLGHPNGSGEYHTHVTPACLYDIEDSTMASPMVGYAFDYYPIYGGYGHTNALDTNSEIVRLRSSYRLRNMVDRTTLPNGTILPESLHGPTLDSVPLGGYMEDFEYIEGLGDLDEHNGRFSITRDYPSGIYTYHTTIGWVNDVYGYGIKPVFPYVIGTAYYGEVFPADGNTGPNSGFVEITEPVTLYVYQTTETGSKKEAIDFQIYPNPSSGLLNIDSKDLDDSETYLIQVFAVNGAMVKEISASGATSNLDIRFLANGLYHIKLTSSKSSSSFRLVVAK
ncbi:MAG: YHYH protein [Bacteroidia bacterium]